MTQLLLLQAKHAAEGGASWGVDGETGALCDMTALGIWEPVAVKAQTYKTAVEVRPTADVRGSSVSAGFNFY